MTKKMAAGGQASSYEDMTAGSGSGLGRLQKTSIASKTKTQKLKKGGIARMGDGGLPTDAEMKEDDLRKMQSSLNRYYDKADNAARRKNGKNYEDIITATLSDMGKRAKQTEGDYRPAQGFYGGGMTKMAKGGKAEAFEGSAADMAQDKKLAKKRGMSLAEWEKSSADKKHDTQKSMKGLKMGGKAKMARGGSAHKPLPFGRVPGGPGGRPASGPGMYMPYNKGGKAEMHDKGCKCMSCGGKAKYAKGGMSTAQDGMKAPLRPAPSATAKMAKGGKVTFGSMQPLPGTKTVGPIRPTVGTGGANMKKDGMKGQLRAKASGAKPTNMMKPLGMTKMAKGGKVRGTGIAQRGTKFIGEV